MIRPNNKLIREEDQKSNENSHFVNIMMMWVIEWWETMHNMWRYLWY